MAAAIKVMPTTPILPAVQGGGVPLSVVIPEDRVHAPVPLRPRAPRPDRDAQIIAAASAKRALIAEEAGVADLAQDTAQSIGAGNSVEAMLADQMAACHNAAMRLVAEASVAPDLDATVRLTNASARMMQAFQEGALTLHRLRTGGRQVVTVQHVSIGEGGRAIVAGNIQPERWAGETHE